MLSYTKQILRNWLQFLSFGFISKIRKSAELPMLSVSIEVNGCSTYTGKCLEATGMYEKLAFLINEKSKQQYIFDHFILWQADLLPL